MACRETIEGTIERLEEQAGAGGVDFLAREDSQDTEKQTWCSSELKNNEKTRRRHLLEPKSMQIRPFSCVFECFRWAYD